MVAGMYGTSSMDHRIARGIKRKAGCQRILIVNTPLAVKRRLMGTERP
jgi:hypothetical protein